MLSCTAVFESPGAKVLETLDTIAAMRSWRAATRCSRLGFVPTMGALHAGHRALIDTARAECDGVVVSVFVNPTQFGPGEDHASYPRDMDADLAVCTDAGVDAVFAPSTAEVYPRPSATRIDVPQLSAGLCGAERPGHFAGVCLVVAKLFNMVQPDVAFFGQKDAQQAAVLQRMVADLDMPVNMRICPTVREGDGLALSSRNAYLDPAQRRQAAVLFRSLEGMREQVARGQRCAETLLSQARREIQAAGPCEIGYVELVDPDSLEPVQQVSGPTLAAVAVTIAGCRLIDNVLITEISAKQ